MEDWVVEIKTEKREMLTLPDGATMHFTSRHIAQEYVKEWKERNHKDDAKARYINYKEITL